MPEGSSAGAEPVTSPAWFDAALAWRPEVRSVRVDGADVRYRRWAPAERQRDGVVFVHGGAAHAQWWDHVAPLLATGAGVVALDLSGHGDSDWRAAYTRDGWVEEIVAVAADAGLGSRPVVVGHSMGGTLTLQVAHLHGSGLAGAVIVDSPLRQRSPEEQAALARQAHGPLRRYPTREAALSRFRLTPDDSALLDGGYLDFAVAHVAATSIRQHLDGWSWKFDRRVFDRPRPAPIPPSVNCPVVLLRAERGLLTSTTVARTRETLGDAVTTTLIPDAGHHVMLDRPLELVAALRVVTAHWQGDDDAGFLDVKQDCIKS